MHIFDMPQSVIDRVVAKRGREHIFDDLDPARTALVVVDLQNAFMLEEVAHAFVPGSPDIVPNVNRLAATVRAEGGTVVWIQTEFVDWSDWSVLTQMSGAYWTGKRAEALKAGSKGFALWDALEALPDDLYVTKYRFSAFIEGGSELEAILRARGIDTVLITGTVTNVCCESTARDAMMRNFRTIMVSDGNAAENDAEHKGSLVNFYLTFGDVMTTDEVVSRLQAPASLAQAAE
jgi:ureidoacrylate peracid hydrolase